MDSLKPPRLNKGNLIGIVAPASTPSSGEMVEKGVRYLESRGYRVKANQVCVIILVFFGRRQFVPWDVKLDSVEAFGLIAGGDALEGDNQMVLGLACACQFEMTFAILGRQRSVIFDRKRIFSEGP